jgi:hypothetical protein
MLELGALVTEVMVDGVDEEDGFEEGGREEDMEERDGRTG